MMLRSLVKIQYCTRALAVVVVNLELHLQGFLGTNVCLRHAKESSLYLTRPLESTLGSRPLLQALTGKHALQVRLSSMLT